MTKKQLYLTFSFLLLFFLLIISRNLLVKGINQVATSNLSIQTPVQSTSSVITFTRNLTLGMTGSDVKELQVYLNNNGFALIQTGAGSAGEETNYFGHLTQLALIKFQEVNRSTILDPLNLKHGTGFFGSSTIAFINTNIVNENNINNFASSVSTSTSTSTSSVVSVVASTTTSTTSVVSLPIATSTIISQNNSNVIAPAPKHHHNTTLVTTPCSATGGTASESGPYCINTFTSDGTFTVPSGSISADLLIVAGGGGGGGVAIKSIAGGGGAGGLIYLAAQNITGSNTITVGAGGIGGIGSAGTNGSNSIFGSNIAIGGGGGGTNDGLSGGSGGGAGYPGSGGTGTNGQGNNGSTGSVGMYANGGGGGGASAASYGCTGGIGLPYDISGISTYYSGGGGSFVFNAISQIQDFSSSCLGGLGGSSSGANGNAIAGIANTGGGGGASYLGIGGTGGSGVVIVRYFKTSVTLSSIAVSHAANKLAYSVGSSLDITGLTIVGTYSDGSTSTEAVSVGDVTGFDSSALTMNQILTVSYGGKTTTYTVNIVSPPTITSISPATGVNIGVVSPISITGTNFMSGALVKLTKARHSDINCTGASVDSPTAISGVSCDLTGVPTGAWNVVVTTAAGTATSTGGFLVTVSI